MVLVFELVLVLGAGAIAHLLGALLVWVSVWVGVCGCVGLSVGAHLLGVLSVRY